MATAWPPVIVPWNIAELLGARVKVPEDRPVTVPLPSSEPSCWLLVPMSNKDPSATETEEFVQRRLFPPESRSDPAEIVTPPVKVLAPERIRVPLPALTISAVPKTTPERVVLLEPAIVSALLEIPIFPAIVRLPPPAVNVWTDPSAIALLIIWALVELFTMPPPPLVMAFPDKV